MPVDVWTFPGLLVRWCACWIWAHRPGTAGVVSDVYCPISALPPVSCLTLGELFNLFKYSVSSNGSWQ